MATLTIHSGPGKGRTFKISGEPQSIGRAGDFQILDTSASRKHAEIFKLGEMLFVRDLNSRNGTFVNDQKIEKETHLRSGDHIRIGASVLAFDSGSVHEEPHEFVQGTAPGAGTVEIHLGGDAQDVSAGATGAEKSLNRLVAMYDIARILGCEQTVQGILEKVLDASMQIIKPTYSYIFVRDEIGDRLIPKAWRDPVTDQRRAISRSIVNRAMKHRHSILTADAGADKRFFKSESVVTASIKSVICAPLISRDRITGVIYLGRDVTQFTDADLELATAVAFQAGIALENAHAQSDRRSETVAIVKTLVGASDLRCPGLRGHSERVAAYTAAIAEKLKLGQEETEEAVLAALLHDIGKMDISENTRLAVSSAVGRVVPHEYCHPWLGAKMLENIPAMKNILPGIKYHHERLDGFGGPEGLTSEHVPFIARIIAVANRFDHLAADVMPDGTKYTINEALELIEQPGEGLDDAVTAALVDAQKSGTGISLPKLVLQDYC